VAASTQMAVAKPRSPGHWTGRVAAAVATMPVPITDANQLGPRLAKASAGRSRSRRGPPRPGWAGPGEVGRVVVLVAIAPESDLTGPAR
jgi:hypothetical protein